MKTAEHRSNEEKPVMRPDGVHDGLDELGLLVVIVGSLIILGLIALAV
jgi:hypothetical protein